MGIGNLCSGHYARQHPWKLITPHGDREPCHAVLQPLRDRKLITPHGDRERKCPQVQNQVPWLITPHGDRELTTHIFDPPLAFLITPHGDRERGHRPVNELRDLDSLPLMGIGNPAGKEEDEQHEHLITPHGDRELSGVTTPDGKTPSHYPSWGSGTGASDGSGPRAAEAHYPSWGSGTIGTRPP